MALEDTRAFLEDLLFRYDPDVDLSDGSRAQIDLIDPILSRIGADPFDEDITTFVTERIRAVYPDLAISEEDALQDTLIDPMRVLIEPLTRELKLVKLRSSLRNIESLSDDEVDALMANFFESRITGGFAVGVVRTYFSVAQSISVSQLNPATAGNGLRFRPSRPQSITADQMLLNVEGSEFYFDINYTAENRGDEYNIEPNAIKTIGNLPTATRVANLRRFRNGAPREDSITFAARTEASVSDKTLTVERGIIRTLTEAFPELRRLFVVGFRDPEMQRDVIKGGSLGPIPDDDTFGAFYGTGTPVDDLDGDATTGILDATGGNFTTRVGAVGADPVSWFVSLVYVDGATTVVVDARITEVLSATQVRTDHEIPLSVTTVTWALRQRSLTISDIPGGITLPDTAAGTLEIVEDEVHIGGKTDVYVSGQTEEASAQITSLTDEQPVYRGADARTAATNVVQIHDTAFATPVFADPTLVETGWSLVLEEGVDADSYRILAVTPVAGPIIELTLDQTMTGTQANLSWKIVDDITTELTDPKDIKLFGGDMVTSAGSTTVVTLSAANFIDANVLADDILRLEGDESVEGDYTITEVSAVSLEITPAPERTVPSVAYTIFRRSEAVDPPVVRITSLELLDSAGAPTGTVIPYRDPVLSTSRAFQNEGASLAFDGLAIVGMVTSAAGAGYAVGSATLDWEVLDKDRFWDAALFTGTFTFSAGGPFSAADVVTQINADLPLTAAGVKAAEITYGGDSYVGFVSDNILRFTGGSALTTLGLGTIYTNASFRPFDASTVPEMRTGDAYEVLEGNSAGTTGRIIQLFPAILGAGTVFNGGYGPVGPNAVGYNLTPFTPDVGVRTQVGRSSVGSARTYFLDPTSAEFDYAATTFSVEGTTRTLVYRPDPENRYTLLPAQPTTVLPNTGTTSASPDQLVDAGQDFQLLNIKPGDLLEILYIPIDGTALVTTPLALTGLTLILRFDSDPFITVTFPSALVRQEAADYINEQVGEDIATIVSGALRLQTESRRLEIDPSSTALTVLGLGAAPTTNDHPDQGIFIIAAVPNSTTVSLALSTPFTVGTPTSDTQYRIRRYVQRVSSTAMNENQDATGLYYVDVELLSASPGNEFNIEADVTLTVAGHRSDGYRLSVENSTLTFSRAEVLLAEISRTILLVGSSDSPEEYVQISQQNVSVNYDRSPVVDEIQSFVDADGERVVCEEILARHLFPHFVRLNWAYVGGSSEPVTQRALEEALDEIEPDTEMEVGDLVKVVRTRGATSVYTPDEDVIAGRQAPLLVVIIHNEDRQIVGVIVKDFIGVTRLQRFLPDELTLRRISPGGIS